MADRSSLLAGNVADRGLKDLDTVRVTLEREIRRLLANLDTERGSDALLGDRDALKVAVRVRKQVVDFLKSKGVEIVVDMVTKRAIESAKIVAKAGAPIPTDVQKVIERIVTSHNEEIADAFDKGAEQIRLAINAGTMTSSSLGDLMADAADAVGTTVGKVQAAVDSAIMASGRAVTVKAALNALEELGKGKEDEILFLYVGPEDPKNRPFCRKYVNTVVTAKTMKSLDNGQDLPAEYYCGGYNCRHSWAPIPREEAKISGYKIWPE